jgi:hypothetical protein
MAMIRRLHGSVKAVPAVFATVLAMAPCAQKGPFNNLEDITQITILQKKEIRASFIE